MALLGARWDKVREFQPINDVGIPLLIIDGQLLISKFLQLFAHSEMVLLIQFLVLVPAVGRSITVGADRLRLLARDNAFGQFDFDGNHLNFIRVHLLLLGLLCLPFRPHLISLLLLFVLGCFLRSLRVLEFIEHVLTLSMFNFLQLYESLRPLILQVFKVLALPQLRDEFIVFLKFITRHGLLMFTAIVFS